MSTEFGESVAKVLEDASVPCAEINDTAGDPEGDWGISEPGYNMHSGAKYADVTILARTGIPDTARQAERDGLLQTARSALAEAGYTVTLNEYGTMHVTRKWA